MALARFRRQAELHTMANGKRVFLMEKEPSSTLVVQPTQAHIKRDSALVVAKSHSRTTAPWSVNLLMESRPVKESLRAQTAKYTRELSRMVVARVRERLSSLMATHTKETLSAESLMAKESLSTRTEMSTLVMSSTADVKVKENLCSRTVRPLRESGVRIFHGERSKRCSLMVKSTTVTICRVSAKEKASLKCPMETYTKAFSPITCLQDKVS